MIGGGGGRGGKKIIHEVLLGCEASLVMLLIV